MSTSKEFIQVANQLPALAKAYFNHLRGTPDEIAKQQQELLKHVKSLHRQLRVKGTAMVKVAKTGGGAKGKVSFLEDETCPAGMYKCNDGTCVQTASSCGSEGLIGNVASKAKSAKKTAPAKKKPSASKKKK